MSEARKISIRKILQVTVTVMVTCACITAILSASRLQKSKRIQGVRINIKNSQYGFINKEEVKALLVNDRNTDVLKTSVGKLDARKIEHIVDTNQWVAEAQVYIDNDKVVHVNLTQRVPLARVFDQAGNSYYIDKDLKAMDLSDKYVHYTTVVTNVPVLDNDSMNNVLRSQIVKVVQYVEQDSFWKAQISQIILNDNRQFEVVPVLGNQKILIGDTTQLDAKFDNLFAFYKKVLNRIGWDKYEVLDARYAGQVVATPALPWKPPAGNGMSNMNWVKSIIGSDTSSRSYGPSAVPVKLLPTLAMPVAAKPTPQPAAKTVAPQATAKQVVTKPAAKPVVPVVSKQTVTNKPVVKAATMPANNKVATTAKKQEVKQKAPEKKMVVKDTKPKPQAKVTVKKPENKTINKKVITKEKSPPPKKTKENEEKKTPKYIYQ